MIVAQFYTRIVIQCMYAVQVFVYHIFVSYGSGNVHVYAHERQKRKWLMKWKLENVHNPHTLHIQTYRIAGNFRGYKCSWFSNIYIHEFNTACIHVLAKGCYSAKIKSAKTFLKLFPRKVYTHENYPLYGSSYKKHSFRQLKCCFIQY